ncbi:hypothetical protein [Candidatus Nitrospira nitrificans]|uniref:Uncharacterized protein n=1 Tax=Candidatus Nitrospira nitrificans TaxID=1742973 RepID=A0A0S4LJV5_9BACT|nr:hypothetical protein [Candidatus Nitrospira nitrificans]CUS37535.1 hypothetical protein COMA2_30320 [Candidatus Nitrospira nitrificans]
MPKGGTLSRKVLEATEAELAVEMAEFRESQRLYDEQQTANGNAPKIFELPSIYANADDDWPYSCPGKPDEEPYSLILLWRKPKHSAWASSVLKLMVNQRVFHEIEIGFLVSKAQHKQPTHKQGASND